MKVSNIHTRVISQPKEKIAILMKTLASEDDMMLATDKWPPMRLNNGLRIGSKGGHGPIRYAVTNYIEGELIEFKFSKPKGFIGIHKFELHEINENSSKLKHAIDMNTRGIDVISWNLFIRWLHDAYIEDALDKVESHFSVNKKKTEWSLWIKFLRKVFKPQRKRRNK